jgi:hypothetical protein
VDTVSSPGPGSIVVELGGGELISGVLRDEAGARRVEGWLELLTALEEAHRQRLAPSPGDRATEAERR